MRIPMIAFTIDLDSNDLRIFINGVGQFCVSPTHPRRWEIVSLLNLPETPNVVQELTALVSSPPQQHVKVSSLGDLVVRHQLNSVVYKGKEITHYPVKERILYATRNGLSLDSAELFLHKLDLIPSNYIKTELCRWLGHEKLTLTPSGSLIGFVRVTPDLKTFDTRLDHSIGTTVTMPRGDVCDSGKRDGAGLEFYTYENVHHHYASLTGVTLSVVVEPQSIVDYVYSGKSASHPSFFRACSYTVIGTLI